MLEILNKITEGRGELADLEKLEILGEQIQQTALCGLGQTAPNPVLSTIRHFRHEYIDHILHKHCEAGICPGLVRAPCQSACPAGVDVPGFVSLVGEKRYSEALLLHRERNPFAAVCARVCFHTCEDRCRRSSLDNPVSVRGIKRFMVDQEITLQVPEAKDDPEKAKRKIAVIGAGPAGLSCAYFLARLGYKPKIFEAEPRPGGMLVQAIPAYRLPRETLAREIRMIENLGVDIVDGQRLGKDFTLKQLREDGYEAVFIGIGSPEGIHVNLPGNDAEGVTEALAFLKQYNLKGSVPVGKNVIVIGGGNAATDAARTAIRLGAETVTIVYRRTREEMPAYTEEIEESIAEGIDLKVLTSPAEIITENGKAVGLRCAKVKLGEFDRSGRRRPNAQKEDLFDLKADQIIFAIGQTLEPKVFKTHWDPEDDSVRITKEEDLKLLWGSQVKADPVTGQTTVPWIFAGGDVVTGPSSVVEAIGMGEAAAVGIDQYLYGESDPFWREEKENDTAYDPDAEPAPYIREKIPVTSVERRRNNFDEVEKSWTEAVALRQAKRCLRCDYGK